MDTSEDAVAVRGSYAVVQTYASQERYAVKNLGNQGYDAFCPLENRPSRADPSRMVETPLFPSYVFVLLVPDQQWRSINNTYGVIRLLTDRHREHPSPLLLHDLDDRVAFALDKLRKSVANPFAPGTVVRVTQGPFMSFEGKVESLDRRRRAWVLLSIFGRDTRVEFYDPVAELEEVVE